MAAAEKEAQLAWERENGPKFSAFAFGSAALGLIAAGLQFAILSGSDGDRQALAQYQDRSALFFASGVVQALSVAALAGVIVFFRRAITARFTPALQFLWLFAFLAPVLLLVGNVLATMHGLDQIDDYFAGRSDSSARELLRATPPTNLLSVVGLLLLALTFVNLGITGMRAGLFSRFIGILGALCGLLVIVGGGFVQIFWTVAVGFLLLNRWPNGRGPAWDRVEAIQWPSAAQMTQAQGGRGEAPAPPPVPENSSSDGEEPASPPARKRKKKKRR